MAYPTRSYGGNATPAVLTSAISSVSTTFTVANTSTWLDVKTGLAPVGNIVVAIEYGTVNEEKILCTLSGTTFTIITNGRNYDGGTFSLSGTHPVSTTATWVWSALEASEAQDAVQTVKPLMTGTGLVAPTALTTISTGTGGTTGTSTVPATADHAHAVSSTSLSSWLATTNTATTNVTVPAANIAAGTLGSTVVVPLTNLATGTLPASVSTSNVAWTGGGTTWTSGTAPIIGPIAGYNDYIILCNASVKASSAGTNIVVTVNQSASNTMSSPTAIVSNLTWGAAITQSYCVTAVGAYSPGSSASFYVQPALTNATIYSVTITVIGIN